MDLCLHGRQALVTGGSAGIGLAIVQALAAEACAVAFCGRDESRVQSALQSCQGLPGEVSGRVLDVQDSPAFAQWLADLGRLDVLVLNVSALSGDWSAALSLDVQATVACAEAAIPWLLQSDAAAITYIGSKAGSLAAPNSAAYGAAKAAMAHFMKSLSSRLLPRVRVNTISPGDTLFEGGLWDRVQREDAEAFAKVLQRNPMQRLADPAELARVVAFISSPAASFVSGANWYVDGGSVAHVQF